MTKDFNIKNNNDLTGQIIHAVKCQYGKKWHAAQIQFDQAYHIKTHFYLAFYYDEFPYLATCSIDDQDKPTSNIFVSPLYSPFGDLRLKWRGLEVTM